MDLWSASTISLGAPGKGQPEILVPGGCPASTAPVDLLPGLALCSGQLWGTLLLLHGPQLQLDGLQLLVRYQALSQVLWLQQRMQEACIFPSVVHHVPFFPLPLPLTWPYWGLLSPAPGPPALSLGV